MHATGQCVDAGDIDENTRAIFLEVDLAWLAWFEIGQEVANLAQRWFNIECILGHGTKVLGIDAEAAE